MTACDTHK